MDSQVSEVDLNVLIARLEAASDEERAKIEATDPQGDGAWEQRDRIALAAVWVCRILGGDLVEIGCLNGSTTVRLAGVARKFGRRVVAIDPWEIGTQNCQGGEYENFCETTKPYADVIDVMRMRSDDPVVLAVLAQREIAFAFVDGLHTYEAALADLHAVSHASLIALDDTRWSEEVRRAYFEFDRQTNQNWARFIFGRDYWRESWII